MKNQPDPSLAEKLCPTRPTESSGRVGLVNGIAGRASILVGELKNTSKGVRKRFGK